MTIEPRQRSPLGAFYRTPLGVLGPGVPAAPIEPIEPIRITYSNAAGWSKTQWIANVNWESVSSDPTTWVIPSAFTENIEMRVAAGGSTAVSSTHGYSFTLSNPGADGGQIRHQQQDASLPAPTFGQTINVPAFMPPTRYDFPFSVSPTAVTDYATWFTVFTSDGPAFTPQLDGTIESSNGFWQACAVIDDGSGNDLDQFWSFNVFELDSNNPPSVADWEAAVIGKTWYAELSGFQVQFDPVLLCQIPGSPSISQPAWLSDGIDAPESVGGYSRSGGAFTGFHSGILIGGRSLDWFPGGDSPAVAGGWANGEELYYVPKAQTLTGTRIDYRPDGIDVPLCAGGTHNTLFVRSFPYAGTGRIQKMEDWSGDYRIIDISGVPVGDTCWTQLPSPSSTYARITGGAFEITDQGSDFPSGPVRFSIEPSAT